MNRAFAISKRIAFAGASAAFEKAERELLVDPARRLLHPELPIVYRRNALGTRALRTKAGGWLRWTGAGIGAVNNRPLRHAAVKLNGGGRKLSNRAGTFSSLR